MKRVFSGIQPSGNLTIGNYIGAMKNFVDLQETYETFYCVVDLHAITARQKPADLRKNSRNLAALYLAAGIDPDKSCLFIQSHVPAHTELAWVLNTMTYMGELSRMTQFKDKLESNKDNQNAGLFNYPVLMAADILLYNADHVPVGDDQKQHIELTRNIAERFNNRYSPTFTVPEEFTPEAGGRIMSLKEPKKKMSKSDKDQNASIYILDDPDVIRKKIRSAVTDSVGKIAYNDDQAGLKNLIDIYSAFSGKAPDKVVEEFKDANYGSFKEAVGEMVVENLKPIQEKYKEIVEDKDMLDSILSQGAEKARYEARKTLSKVYRKVGFYQI